MTARGGSALYTPQLLALAVSLADCPFDEKAPYTGRARSATCGSTVAFSAALDDAQVFQPGVRATACAVGQAAAAIFMAGVSGSTRQRVASSRSAIADWLANDGPLPDWPGFEVLEPAKAYPARHGAILLAWDAALAALPKETADS
jgi:NifU-like protein involved in Fe-S cluster formation